MSTMETESDVVDKQGNKRLIYVIICIAVTIILGVAIGIGIYYATLPKQEPKVFEGESEIITKNVTEGNQTIQVTEVVTGTYSWWDNNGQWQYALDGVDVVAYFGLETDADPIPGDDAYTSTAYGIIWRFGHQANKDLFDADPAQYVPVYGAHCAYAMSLDSIYSGDPKAWTVYNGKLYINSSKGSRSSWRNNKDANIAKADTNWQNRGFDNPH